MSRREVLVVSLLAVIVAAAVGGLWSSPSAVSDVFARPLRLLLGSEQNLSATLLEVSQNSEPVKAASRRLLQPFGMVRLVKTLPVESLESKPAAVPLVQPSTGSSPSRK